jgi:hypothetical protein
MAGGFSRIADLPDLRWAIRGMAVSQALGAACALGLADRLDVSAEQSALDLARACGTDEATVRRLVRLLAGLGVFRMDRDDVITHTDVSLMLRQDNVPSVYAAIRFWTLPAIWRAWGELSGGMTKPAIPFVAANGRSFFDHLAHDPADRDVFHALMKSGGFVNRHAAIAEALTLDPRDVVVDIGGGEGLLLRAILARHPQAQGILFDLPEVVGRCGGLPECRIVAGDFFEAVPAGGSVYILSWILHDWPDEQAVMILRTIRQAISPEARLLIVDRLLNADPGQCDPYDVLEDINMFVLFHGKERTEADFNSLLSQAGFQPLAIRATRPGFAVLETR